MSQALLVEEEAVLLSAVEAPPQPCGHLEAEVMTPLARGWCYREILGEAQGPVSYADLRRLVACGSVGPYTRVWWGGAGAIRLAKSMPSLFPQTGLVGAGSRGSEEIRA